MIIGQLNGMNNFYSRIIRNIFLIVSVLMFANYTEITIGKLK